jgi:hypothetical protein
MSCDQQLKETRRELEVLPRQRESKDKNLAEQLQALAVQVQVRPLLRYCLLSVDGHVCARECKQTCASRGVCGATQGACVCGTRGSPLARIQPGQGSRATLRRPRPGSR